LRSGPVAPATGPESDGLGLSSDREWRPRDAPANSAASTSEGSEK
jgi:hypothetical protein